MRIRTVYIDLNLHGFYVCVSVEYILKGKQHIYFSLKPTYHKRIVLKITSYPFYKYFFFQFPFLRFDVYNPVHAKELFAYCKTHTAVMYSRAKISVSLP